MDAIEPLGAAGLSQPLRTTGHFLHLGLSLQHFFFAVIDGTQRV